MLAIDIQVMSTWSGPAACDCGTNGAVANATITAISFFLIYAPKIKVSPRAASGTSVPLRHEGHEEGNRRRYRSEVLSMCCGVRSYKVIHIFPFHERIPSVFFVFFRDLRASREHLCRLRRGVRFMVLLFILAGLRPGVFSRTPR